MYCGGPQGPEPKAGVSVSHGLMLMSKPAGSGRAVDCRNSTRGHRVTGKAARVRDDLHQVNTEIIKMTNTLSVFDIRKIVGKHLLGSISTSRFTFVMP